MKNTYIYTILSIVVFSSCEKVWVEDLQEKAYDTIRGKYEIKSAVWEGKEPIDINGDGTSSFSYLDELQTIHSGSPAYGHIGNDSGLIEIPYTIDDRHHPNRYVSLTRRYSNFKFKINAVVDGKDESHLEFDFSDQQGTFDFEHSGYGEILLRKEVTFTIKTGEYESEEITGPVLFRYIRTEYRGE